MKILFVVSDLTYPAVEGLHQQAILLMESLVKSGNTVYVAGLLKDDSKVDFEQFGKTGVDVSDIFIRYSGSQTLEGLKNTFGRVFDRRDPQRRELRSLMGSNRFDIVHLDGAAACGFYSANRQCNWVLSIVDPGSRRQFRLMRSSGFRIRGFIHGLNSAIAFVYELLLRRGTPDWHVVSDEDRKYLKRIFRHRAVHAIPVIVPQELLFEGAVSQAIETVVDRKIGTRVVVYCDLRQIHMRESFFASMDDWFRLAQSDAINYVVMGRVKADRELLAPFRGCSVEFLEWADDYVSILKGADIVLLPDRVGTGLKNRAVQCMALGNVVVGTTIAFEGLPAKDGVNCILLTTSHTERSLPRKVNLEDVLGSAAVRRDIGEQARMTVVQQFSSIVVAEQWNSVYRSLISRQL
ncbi:glycosyltransferase [Rhodococcus fascians]|nr:glycosyltransferase [Rhodococcus fascians]